MAQWHPGVFHHLPATLSAAQGQDFSLLQFLEFQTFLIFLLSILQWPVRPKLSTPLHPQGCVRDTLGRFYFYICFSCSRSAWSVAWLVESHLDPNRCQRFLYPVNTADRHSSYIYIYIYVYYISVYWLQLLNDWMWLLCFTIGIIFVTLKQFSSYYLSSFQPNVINCNNWNTNFNRYLVITVDFLSGILWIPSHQFILCITKQYSFTFFRHKTLQTLHIKVNFLIMGGTTQPVKVLV